jgi:hypothetical protein
MKAHIHRNAYGDCQFIGYGACGAPAGSIHGPSPRAKLANVVVNVGRRFQLTPDGNLYLNSRGPHQFSEWTANELYIAAKKGWFGFSIEGQGNGGKQQDPVDDAHVQSLAGMHESQCWLF